MTSGMPAVRPFGCVSRLLNTQEPFDAFVLEYGCHDDCGVERKSGTPNKSSSSGAKTTDDIHWSTTRKATATRVQTTHAKKRELSDARLRARYASLQRDNKPDGNYRGAGATRLRSATRVSRKVRCRCTRNHHRAPAEVCKCWTREARRLYALRPPSSLKCERIVVGQSA